MDMECRQREGSAIRVRGLVQGVGFRPAVWRVANDCHLAGDVCNDAEGVLIRIWGEPGAHEKFVRQLREQAPPLSRIDALERTPLPDDAPDDHAFRIVASRAGDVHTGIVPDAATCDACLREVLDEHDRRHGYAFTNCTHCGPRLSIVRRIPYDRAYTSMSAFPMCPHCQAEYEDPADRRFHAQPNACSECGPRLWLESLDGTRDSGPGIREPAFTAGQAIVETQRLLRAGQIVAIKGLGGFHLAVDATNAKAVARLRSRKRRPDKPLALMARDEAMIRRYCAVNEAEHEQLHSSAAPIVLLEISGPERLAEAVAPRQRCYGFMLPYTPLHHLLLRGLDAPIVLTSGNRSEEPQCIANDEARERLSGIADAWLMHDREIVNRLDDSVVRAIAGAPSLLRRARGCAPAPLRLPKGFAEAPPVLALGGQMKNTFCLLRDGEAIVSQHLGDMQNAIAHAAQQQTLELYLKLFEHRPKAIAMDAHPDYLPGKSGREWAAREGLPAMSVQHHHAHIAACLADNGSEMDAAPVLGIALDGAGYGEDDTIWGGEFLLADYRHCTRLASLAPVPMPGGEQAIRQPWRMAYAHLRRAFEWKELQADFKALPFFANLAGKPLATLDRMIAARFNAPLTSSCGRLFDAVAALLGLCDSASYDGQPAVELEAIVDATALRDGRAYPFAIEQQDGLPRLEPGPMWRSLLDDLRGGVAAGVIAARFHAGLAHGLAKMLDHLASLHGACRGERIALSGGVFQNATLSHELIRLLQARGLEVLRHRSMPANDGGLSLGQACVAAAQLLMGSSKSCVTSARAPAHAVSPCA